MQPSSSNTRVIGLEVALTLGACFVYATSSSIRSNYGVLLHGITAHTGLDYASASFVIAIGQLMFGYMQPVFGVLSLRFSSFTCLSMGALLMGAGLFLTPFCAQVWLLALIFGCVISSGTASLAFGNIMTPVTPRLTPRHSMLIAGIVSGSYGLGSLIFSPVLQSFVQTGGIVAATRFLTILSVMLLPVLWFLTRRPAGADRQETVTRPVKREPIRDMFVDAFRNRIYRHITLAFFTCGFHMSIMETHLFSQMTGFGLTGREAAFALSLVGLGTVVGAVGSGMLCNRFPLHRVLGTIYALRIPLIAVMIVMPKTLWAYIGFTLLFGMTGTATVPPTSGLVLRHFGAAKVGALFGCCYLFHQTGSFCSAWLGGIFENAFGTSVPVWYVSMGLSGVAALLAFTAIGGQERSVR